MAPAASRYTPSPSSLPPPTQLTVRCFPNSTAHLATSPTPFLHCEAQSSKDTESVPFSLLQSHTMVKAAVPKREEELLPYSIFDSPMFRLAGRKQEVRRLAMEVRQLASARPITVLNGSGGQSGSVRPANVWKYTNDAMALSTNAPGVSTTRCGSRS